MKRSSGILMAVSSLPSPYGIGTLGKAAYDFADFLKDAGQSYWQMLPLGPTSYGDSPYQSFSAYAGNPYFIDPDMLAADGLLTAAECAAPDWGSDPRHVDYGKIYESRFTLLRKAYQRGWERDAEAVAAFAQDNARWLPDYALYMACKRHFGMKSWTEWPDDDLRLRKNEAVLDKYRTLLREDMQFFTYLQFLFFRQWTALRDYVHQQGIRIIGDLPIYVAMDSADVWAEPQFFQLDDDLVPKAVAGVPPDYFTADGQLWGNPLYDWKGNKQGVFDFWKRRIQWCAAIYDAVRIDHFRAFHSYWSVPTGAENAREGHWEDGPGTELLHALQKSAPQLELIAEDLGDLGPEALQFVRTCGIPGMKVMVFAFDPVGESAYLPHNCQRDSVIYTGTHDTPTFLQWLRETDPDSRLFASRYLRLRQDEGLGWGVISGAWAAPSRLAIAPLQDVLGLGSDARMNTPGTMGSQNWSWRVRQEAFNPYVSGKLREITRTYRR